MHVHARARGEGGLPGLSHGAGADVERRHLAGSGGGRGHRDHPAAGAQIRHPGAWDQAGLDHGVDQQKRIFLRGIDLDPDYQWAIVTDFTGLSGFLLTRTRTVSDDFYQELLNRASVKGVKGRITPTRQPAADTVTV